MFVYYFKNYTQDLNHYKLIISFLKNKEHYLLLSPKFSLEQETILLPSGEYDTDSIQPYRSYKVTIRKPSSAFQIFTVLSKEQEAILLPSGESIPR